MGGLGCPLSARTHRPKPRKAGRPRASEVPYHQARYSLSLPGLSIILRPGANMVRTPNPETGPGT